MATATALPFSVPPVDVPLLLDPEPTALESAFDEASVELAETREVVPTAVNRAALFT